MKLDYQGEGTILTKNLDFDEKGVFRFCNLPKIQRGDPCKMPNINVVQPY